MFESDEDRVVKTTPEPSTSGQNVRMVLVASLVVAILAMIVIAAFSTH